MPGPAGLVRQPHATTPSSDSTFLMGAQTHATPLIDEVIHRVSVAADLLDGIATGAASLEPFQKVGLVAVGLCGSQLSNRLQYIDDLAWQPRPQPQRLTCSCDETACEPGSLCDCVEATGELLNRRWLSLAHAIFRQLLRRWQAPPRRPTAQSTSCRM